MRYSQNDEERYITRYFGAKAGRFLDIGANDGVRLSNTRAMALRGWGGVLVEPSPAAFERLSALYANRPDIQCLNIAIGDREDIVTLHESGEHLGGGDVALLSSTIERETHKWTREVFTPVEVQMLTYHQAVGDQLFDFITIDAEGMDLVILQQIDLSHVGCRMLIVEVNDNDPTPFMRHCKGHGMRLVGRTPENMIFQR